MSSPLGSCRTHQEYLRHLLPSQGPLSDFIHHNTLHAFEEIGFEGAVVRGEWLYRARGLPTLLDFRKLFAKSPLLNRENIAEAMKHWILDRKWSKEYPNYWIQKVRPSEHVRSAVTSVWQHQYLLIQHRPHTRWIRCVSGYLDQGVSYWRPNAEASNFFEWIGLMQRSNLNFFSRDGGWPLRRKNVIDAWLASKNSGEFLLKFRDEVLGDSSLEFSFWLETCLEVPGWMGLVSEVEKDSSLLRSSRSIAFMDALALKVALDWDAMKPGVAPVLERVEVGVLSTLRASPLFPFGETFEEEPREDRELRATLLVCQGMQEHRVRAVALENLAKRAASMSHQVSKRPRPEVQVAFCIDDRECSLRRHLEAEWPAVETLGVAGFFGVDAFFQKAGERFLTKQCPVPVRPQHIVEEYVEGKGLDPEAVGKHQWIRSLGAVGASIRLAASILNPTVHAHWLDQRKLERRRRTKIHFERDVSAISANDMKDQSRPSSLVVGYTVSEMADRVVAVCQMMGLDGRDSAAFAPLVILVAHGASSINNPHFAAYDCGACAGRPGTLNARVLAGMANHPDVRVELCRRGWQLPEEVVFLGAFHDTTADEWECYGVEDLPENQMSRFQQLADVMERALSLNALERCNRLEMDRHPRSPLEARKIVVARATAIYEPRPELNHANNALAIVGPREWSKGLSFDRRAFLVSYDKNIDHDGDILAKILSAIIPVCGGINLEYYFSKIDNDRYGASTKLPHHVNGLLGVTNGVTGDLRTGLPAQMIELHEPVRLGILIDQDVKLVRKIIDKISSLRPWVEGDWVSVFAIKDRESGEWERIA